MYLKYILIEAVSKVSNITGVYGAYLKKLYANALKPIVLEKINILPNNLKYANITLYGDSYTRIKEYVNKNSILYLDPPYNARQYGSNYHLLNTISLGFKPVIKLVKSNPSVTGLPEDLPVSNWCSKVKILKELEKYLRLDFGQLIMSYNNESLITKKQIVEIFEKYGKTKVIEKKYKKYKSNKNENENNIIEYLFICIKT